MYANKPLLSVISPVYNSRECLHELVGRIEKAVAPLGEFEILLVDDASSDGSWEIIEELAATKPFVKGIRLSRNFGQHNAITAGLEHCFGEWIVVMDCDLQDRPEEIAAFFRKAQEGYQIVYGQRILRRDNWFKRMSSRLFYYLFGYLTDTKQDPTIGNFGIYHREVIAAILSMNDYQRYFPTMVRWVGFRNTKIEVEHADSARRRSSYSFKKLLRLALYTIISFSDKPLRLMIKAGLLISSISFLFAIYNVVLFFEKKIEVLGYTSLIVSIWFLSGLIIMLLGIVGLYVGKTFEKVKERPIYLIMKRTF